jgi:hypothetical protein
MVYKKCTYILWLLILPGKANQTRLLLRMYIFPGCRGHRHSGMAAMICSSPLQSSSENEKFSHIAAFYLDNSGAEASPLYRPLHHSRDAAAKSGVQGCEHY